MLAPDIEELVVAYLTSKGLPNVSVIMPPDPPFPFYLINALPGKGDDMVTDYPVVSIHAFNGSRTAASSSARAMHKIMKDLTAQIPIQMSDGSYSSIDHLDVVESPHWQDYGDKEMWRYVARYHIDLRVNKTT